MGIGLETSMLLLDAHRLASVRPITKSPDTFPNINTFLDFVNNNPSAFEDAYFDFEWLKIYAA